VDCSILISTGMANNLTFIQNRAEQTYEYTAPEALLNATWYQGPTSRTLKYV